MKTTTKRKMKELLLLRMIGASTLLVLANISQASVLSDESLSYCDATGGGSYEWISVIELADLNSTSSQHDYSNYTNQIANIKTGANSISLTPGFKSSAYDEHWAVYIDYNQDGDFDDSGEQVVTANGDSALTESFNVPSSTGGVTTRMRVAMKYDRAVSGACRNITAGEIEDYTVSISEAATPPPTGNMQDACQTEASHIGESLVDGDVICLAGDRQTFKIPDSDDYNSIAISTSHGTGNLTLFAKNGSRPETDFSDPYSKHVGNNECVILDNLSDYWSYIEVLGGNSGASLVVDFNAASCRVATGEIEEIKDNYGNDGYTQNSINVKVFRAEFSDQVFDWDDTEMRAEFDKVVDFYTRTSYGQFTVNYEITHPIINLGKRMSYYENLNSNAWHADWQAAVLAETGIDAKNPGGNTIVLVSAPKLDGYNSTAEAPYVSLFHKEGGVVAHELGHAMGIRHAYGLEGDRKVIGAGTDIKTESINYGGLFSMMGKGSREFMDFDLMHKQYMGWLKQNDVPMITSSGIYRIYAFDQGANTHNNTSGKNIGLRLKSGNTEEDYTYWLEYRTTNEKYGHKGNNTLNGVLVYLQGFLEKEQNPKYWKHTSHLLDMTPDSNETGDWWGDDFADSALEVNKSYTDKWDGFTIKTVGKGGAVGTADAWIEVEVIIH